MIKWYIETTDDYAPWVLVGDVKPMVAIYKSIRRYEHKHGCRTGRGWVTWQDLPTKKSGKIALVFGDSDLPQYVTLVSSADAILDHIVAGDWEEYHDDSHINREQFTFFEEV